MIGRSIKLSIGDITVWKDDYGIAKITMESGHSSDDSLLLEAQRQLLEYDKGKLKYFELPLSLHGTNFQKKVWNELLNIPWGKTISYSEIANNIGHNKAYRAVGTAVGENPVPIIIPCHRVIRKDGKLGGFALGTLIKYKLLSIENDKYV
ncbi:MAG: methylated-DNA--[protein]-cysteine S-methyltransferase [Tissierellia bacterium]|nr:methylated-DNA--[protein]-cysteine S-methyltransferase [Tissierellia bacterium]